MDGLVTVIIRIGYFVEKSFLSYTEKVGSNNSVSDLYFKGALLEFAGCGSDGPDLSFL
jgi:hypothetical protein